MGVGACIATVRVLASVCPFLIQNRPIGWNVKLSETQHNRFPTAIVV